MKNYARTQINIHIIFCLTAIAALLLISSGMAAADDIYVNPGGSADYMTIQAAVIGASPNDTIIVAAEKYTENVDIPADKENLTICSESGPGLTMVHASDPRRPVFKVTANSTTIDGFNITGATDTCDGGIYLNSVEGCSILNNTASNNEYGISLISSSSNKLYNNTVDSNNGRGISLYFSSSNELYNNTASNTTYYGIYLCSSSSSILSGNRMQDNKYNFYAKGGSLDTNIVYANNSVDGKPIYYLVEVSDLEINSSSNAGTVYLIDCKNIIVKDLTVEKEGYGILLYNTTDSKLENNTASYNYDGIYLCSSSSNKLLNNTVDSNGENGIYLKSSSYNELYNNTASNHDDYGIYLEYSSNDNTLYNNTLSNNEDGIYLEYSSNDNTLENNNASDNEGGIRLSSSDSNTLENNTANSNTNYGIRLDHSSSNTLSNNTANSKSGEGISLESSSSNELYSNIASNNYHGVTLSSSSNNELYNNTASDNSNCGIWLSSSSSNELYNNTASDNYYGILLGSSEGNRIFLNDLLGNSVQITGDENNVWNSSEPVNYLYNGEKQTSYLGNHYSDYSGLDSDGNGIGDTPYVFNIASPLVNDSYPLLNASDYYTTIDTEAPSGVSNLQATAGLTWINWTWNIPSDVDFNHTILYLNGAFLANTSDSYYNATGLHENTEYELGTLTVDFSGNVNETWINDTATTDKTEAREPSSSGGSGTGEARVIPAGTEEANEPGENPDGKEDESGGSDTLLPPSGDSDTPKTPTASDVTKASGEDGNEEEEEEENTPGFELVFAVSGLLAALHFVRKG